MDQIRIPESVLKYTAFVRSRIQGITRILLFGSYAKGTFGENSDIDLAIVFDRLSDSFDMQVQLMKLRRKFDTRIEPHPIREADLDPSNPFVREVFKTGLEI